MKDPMCATVHLNGQLMLEHVHDGPEVLLHDHGGVGVRGCETLDLLRMVGDLGVCELEPVSGGDDHRAVRGGDHTLFAQLDERGEGDAGVRAVEHSGEIGAGGGVHQLLLARLLHHAVALGEGVDGAVDGDGVADLDGRGEGVLRLDALEVLPPLHVRAVQGVCVLGLRDDHARDAVYEAEILAHLEALEEGVHVAEVSARDDHPVGHLPVELLQDLNRRRLLALQTERVERVGEVDGQLRRHLTDEAHAPVEVRVDRHHQRAVRDGLHQLGQRDLVGGQEHDGRDLGRGGVRGQRGGGVAGGGASHGHQRLAHLAEAVHLAHEDRHAEILEGTSVRVATLLHPQVGHVELLLAKALGPEQVRVSLEHAYDVLVGDAREHPLLLGPHAGAVGPLAATGALVEERLPVLGAVDGERLHVVLHVQQTTVLAAVDDLVQVVRLVRVGARRERHVLCVEQVPVRQGRPLLGLAADGDLIGCAIKAQHACVGCAGTASSPHGGACRHAPACLQGRNIQRLMNSGHCKLVRQPCVVRRLNVSVLGATGR
mmetsp:Transcript_26496/g.44362  ORF Transcript_26496/g.44362 Transcript_26496/m.44362 type:complete len:543 (+) Transcript_26496:450-2078(+)